MFYARLTQPDGTTKRILASAFACASKGDGVLQCPSCDISMVFVQDHKAHGNTINVSAHFRAKAGTPHADICDYKDDPTRPATTKKLLQAIKDGVPILLRLNFDTGLGPYDARPDHPRIPRAHIMPDYAKPLGEWISQDRRVHFSVGCRDVGDVLAITDKIKDIAGPDALARVFVDHHRIVQPWANFAMYDKATPVAETLIALANASLRNFTQFTRGLPALFEVRVRDDQLDRALPKRADPQQISYLYAQEVHSCLFSKNTGIKFSPILPPELTRQIRDSGMRTIMVVATPSIRSNVGKIIANALKNRGYYEGEPDIISGIKRQRRKPVFLNFNVDATSQILPIAPKHVPAPREQLKFGFA